MNATEKYRLKCVNKTSKFEFNCILLFSNQLSVYFPHNEEQHKSGWVEHQLESWRKNLYISGQRIPCNAWDEPRHSFSPFLISASFGVTNPEEVATWSGLSTQVHSFLSFFFTAFVGHYGDKYGGSNGLFALSLDWCISSSTHRILTKFEMLFIFRMVQGVLSGFSLDTSAGYHPQRSAKEIGVRYRGFTNGIISGTVISVR